MLLVLVAAKLFLRCFVPEPGARILKRRLELSFSVGIGGRRGERPLLAAPGVEMKFTMFDRINHRR